MSYWSYSDIRNWTVWWILLRSEMYMLQSFGHFFVDIWHYFSKMLWIFKENFQCICVIYNTLTCNVSTIILLMNNSWTILYRFDWLNKHSRMKNPMFSLLCWQFFKNVHVKCKLTLFITIFNSTHTHKQSHTIILCWFHYNYMYLDVILTFS